MTDSSRTREHLEPPVFVPVALPLDEARALFNAARSVFGSLTVLGRAATDGGELARGMMRLASAIDERTGVAPSTPDCTNPYCRDGWVERSDNESGGAPAFACKVCRPQDRIPPHVIDGMIRVAVATTEGR